MRVDDIHHSQLAIPPNSEDGARTFYGEILEFREKPKPEHPVQRGCVWVEQGDLKLHLGVDRNFVQLRKLILDCWLKMWMNLSVDVRQPNLELWLVKGLKVIVKFMRWRSNRSVW